VVVGAQKVGSGIVVYRIGDSGWRRQIDVAGADQIFTVNIHIGNTGGKAVRDLTLNVQASLLHFGSLEIVREGRNVACQMGCNCVRRRAEGGMQRTIDQRIRILGKDQVVVEIGVIQEKMRPGETAVGGN